MGSIKCEYGRGYQRFFDSTDGRTVNVHAARHLFDDFHGDIFKDTWNLRETNINTTSVPKDETGGILTMILDADNNAEVAALDHADKTQFDVASGLIFECRVRIAVTPTGTGEAVWGMAGDFNADADTMAYGVWFKVDGGTSVVAESDDNTNNNDDISTGVTAGTTTWHIYTIDFTDLTSVKFYIDGERVASGTTFNISAASAANLVMQPMFHIAKASGTGVGTLDVDYVRIWHR